jgi:hypothetical protein
MLDSLQLVRGAVSKERLVPVLSHFAFRDGRVCGFDGRTYINAPAPDITLNLTVPARPFLAAYDAMSATEGGAAKIKLTRHDDRLRISKGRMRVTLPAGPVDAFPFAEPDAAKSKRMPAGFLALLTALRPFVGEDASRPWSASVKIVDGVAYATNNIVLAAARMPTKGPAMKCVLPVQAIDELLRIALDPSHVTADDSAVTFHLPGGAWLRTSLLHDTWPDAKKTISASHAGARLKQYPTAEWADAVDSIRPFCPDVKHEVVVMEQGRIRTQEGEVSAEVGGWKFDGQYMFHIEPLLCVLRAATHLDLASFPRIPWTGPTVEGVLLGMPIPTAAPAATAVVATA